MKSVPLLPVYQGAANEYAASTNALYDRSVAEYARNNNQSGYYDYLLAQGRLKGLDESIFEGLDDPEDKLTKLYGATLADTKESKEWDLQIPDEQNPEKAKNFVGTEVEYLDKILELKQEYKKQEQDLAMEQAKKDAMNGWERAWSNIGAFLGETGIGAEQFVAGVAEFIAGGVTWLTTGEYKDIGLTEAVDWQANQLANFERQYTDYRNINGELTTSGKVWTTIAQGIGQQIPATLANLVAPGSGYAMLYAGSAAGSLNEYLTKTDVNFFQAATKVAISTGLEMLIEKGLGKFWGETGADIAKYGDTRAARDLVKGITNKAGAKVIGKTALRGLKDVAQESLEEFLQEWSNVVVDLIAAKCNTGFEDDVKDLFKEDGSFDISKTFERTLYAGLAGAAGAGFFGGIGKISYERSISKATKSSIFDREYVVEENGKTRKLNFFEKIALETDIRGIYERVQLAQNGNLSQEARTEIWETTVMLGDFFNSLSKEDLDASLKLFNEIHDYAEAQGKKLRTIQTSLTARVTEDMLAPEVRKIKMKEQQEKQINRDKFLSGDLDLVFGTTLLEKLYGAREVARSKGLEESERRRAEKKANKTKEVEATASKPVENEVVKSAENLVNKAFETSSETPTKTQAQIEEEITHQWNNESQDSIAAEIQAIQRGERGYSAKEGEIVKGALRKIWESKQPKKDLYRKVEKKLTKKEQAELEKQEKEQARQEAKQRAEEERKAKEDAYDKAVEQYENAPLTKLLKAIETLQDTKDVLEQESLKAIQEVYKKKLQEELSKSEDKVVTIQSKYENLTEDELVKKVEELEKKTLTAKAGLSNVIEYEVAKDMLSSFYEYNELVDAEMSDAYNARTLNYEQRDRRNKLGDKDYTWEEIQYILYGNSWRNLNNSLNNPETQIELANDLVTEINPLLDDLENLFNEDDASKQKYTGWQELIQKVDNTKRKIYVTNGDKVVSDHHSIFIPKAMVKQDVTQEADFIIQQIGEFDVVGEIVNTFLDPFERGALSSSRYQSLKEMEKVFKKRFPQLKPDVNEDVDRYFVKMILFSEFGPNALIQDLSPLDYLKDIKNFIGAVAGLEKELGRFGGIYQKIGNDIYKRFQQAAFNYVKANFGIFQIGPKRVLVIPGDFRNVLSPAQQRELTEGRINPRYFAAKDSYITKSYIEDPALLTREDGKIDLKNMMNSTAAPDIKESVNEIQKVLEGKIPYNQISSTNPVKAYWSLAHNNEKYNSKAINDYIDSNRMSNELYPRSSKVTLQDLGADQFDILTRLNKGESSAVPGYLLGNNKFQETKNNDWTIILQNKASTFKYYAPIVSPQGEMLALYNGNQQYQVVAKDNNLKRMVIEPIQQEDPTSLHLTEEDVLGWRSSSDGVFEDDATLTAMYNETTFSFQGKNGKLVSLENIMKPSLSEREKKMVTLEDMVNDPFVVLDPKFIENKIEKNPKLAGVNKPNIFMAIKEWLLEQSNGKISLIMHGEGTEPQLANINQSLNFVGSKWKNSDYLINKLKAENNNGKDDVIITFGELNQGANLSIPANLRNTQIIFRPDAEDMGGGTADDEVYINTNKDDLSSKKLIETPGYVMINYNPNKMSPKENFLFVVLHEFQHVLANNYGWASGSFDPDGFFVPEALKTYIDNEPVLNATREYFKNEENPYGWVLYTYTNEQVANQNLGGSYFYGFIVQPTTSGDFRIIAPNGKVYTSYNKVKSEEKIPLTDAEYLTAKRGFSTKVEVPDGMQRYIDPDWWQNLDDTERKQFRSTTQLKRTNELYKKYYANKLKRLDKRVQGFLEDVKNEEGLNKLPRDLATLIREDAATYNDFISWFKQAKDIDEDTFKLFVDNIFPGTEIKTFKELQELTLKLGYALDENGNLQLDSKGNPKENIYRNRGQTFSPDFDKYRAALMQYYDPSLGLKGMQKYVRQAEFLGRTVTASDIKADEEDKREFGDAEQTTNTLEEQVYGERQRLELQVAKYAAMKEREKYKNGEITEEQLNQKLTKLRPNQDGDIELFDKFSDAQLKAMHRKLVAQETKNLGGLEAAERKITQAEAIHKKKSDSQLENEKATRRSLRKIAEILSYMTDEEIKELIGPDAQYFHRDEEGKLIYNVTGRWSLTEDVQAARENLLNRLRGHVEEWKAKQKGRKEAFKQAQKVKAEQQRIAEQKKTVEVKTVEPNKVAPINKIGLKVDNKVVNFKSTTNQIPKVLQKVFKNTFSEENLKASKEEHYNFDTLQNFLKTNGMDLVNLNTQEWLPLLEFFEQSTIEAEGAEANAFKEARLYTLYSMVQLMQFGRTVSNKDYINRANNLMNKESLGTKERAVWKNLMEKINSRKAVAQMNAYIPPKVQEEFETAMVTSVDGSDENFAQAVVHLKEAIADEYKESQEKKGKWQSTWDKVLSFRYTAMLSSPMTWFRNAFSNRIVRRMNGWAEKIGNALTKWSWVGNKIPIDKFTEKIIGFENRTVFDETAKVPIIGKKQGDYILAGTKVKKSVAEWIDKNLIQSGLLHELTEGYSKYDPEKRMKDVSGVNYIVETIIDNYRKQYNLDHTFKTEAFNKFHKLVTKMISDEKYINEATLKYFGKMVTEDIDAGRLYEDSFLRSDLLDARVSEIFAKAQWLAFTDYMRNGNFVTKWLSELGKGDNFFAKYAIPLVAPFAQSSVNWWAETMRYSPFGLGKAIVNLIRYDKYIKKMDERRQVRGEIATPEGFDRYLLVRNLGKGVLGTTLWTIGILLSAFGIAGLSKKGDKYIIHIWDAIELDISNYFNSSSVIAGIATLDSIKQIAKGQNKDWTSILSNVLNAYGETLFLSDLLGEYKYYDGLGGYIKDIPYNFIYSMVPNIMKLTANITHVGKTNYASGFTGKIQRLLAGIPGVPYLLDNWSGAQIDPFTGKKYSGWGLVENGFKQFGFGNTGMNYFGISEVEREAVKHNISLNNLTGTIKVGDKEYNFNKNNMNEKAGQYVNQIVTKLLDGEIVYKNKSYGKMTDEEQKEALKYYIGKAREYAKIDVWTSNGHKYYASKELYNTLKNLGIGNVYLGSKGYVD